MLSFKIEIHIVSNVVNVSALWQRVDSTLLEGVSSVFIMGGKAFYFLQVFFLCLIHLKRMQMERLVRE